MVFFYPRDDSPVCTAEACAFRDAYEDFAKAGAVVIGLSFAAIYPTTLAMAADRYQRNAGTIFGLLFAVGLLGGMLFPWALGHISQAAGVREGMVLPLIGAVMITILVLVIGKRAPAASTSS